MSTSMNKKFILYAYPRTGASAIMTALTAAGINHCHVPFWMHQSRNMNLTTNPHNHIELSKKLFEKYDGFKIEFKQSLQLKEICDENNAGLVLVRRNDYLATLASQIIFGNDPNNLNGKYDKGLSNKSYETWTSTSRKMVYDPNDRRLGWLSYQIYDLFYGNYLIDNIYPAYSNYVTTVDYENPMHGLNDLEEYFGVKIPLTLAASRPLSDYFVNHEEFKSDIEARIKNEINGVQHD